MLNKTDAIKALVELAKIYATVRANTVFYDVTIGSYLKDGWRSGPCVQTSVEMMTSLQDDGVQLQITIRSGDRENPYSVYGEVDSVIFFSILTEAERALHFSRLKLPEEQEHAKL